MYGNLTDHTAPLYFENADSAITGNFSMTKDTVGVWRTADLVCSIKGKYRITVPGIDSLRGSHIFIVEDTVGVILLVYENQTSIADTAILVPPVGYEAALENSDELFDYEALSVPVSADDLRLVYLRYETETQGLTTLEKKTGSKPSLANSLPKVYTATLRQNVPNPFSQETTIVYEVSQDSYIKIELQDILGRQMSILEEGKKGYGIHSVVLQGAKLRAGTYRVLLYAVNPSGTRIIKSITVTLLR